MLPRSFRPRAAWGTGGLPQQARLSYKRYACANAATGGVGSVVPEPLTALCSFTLSEDSMGTSSADFRKNKAGLPRDFITHRYSPFRCFRPGFSKVLPKSRIFSFDP